MLLSEFDDLLSDWPNVLAMNQWVPPRERSVEDGKTVFYVENQGVYLWATTLEGDDPAVWGRFNEEGEGWQAEREPLSRFRSDGDDHASRNGEKQ